MTREEVERKAFDYFQSGFHCAEAVSKTITELFAQEACRDIPRVASGFGGGIGRTHEDTCGALTGGVIAIGYLFGRDNPDEEWRDAYERAAEFRKRFTEEFGSTNCRALLDAFGEQDNWHKCKRMAAGAAGILSDLLIEQGR